MYVTKDGTPVYSATDLVGFLDCEHLTNLDRAAAIDLVKRPERDDPEIELLRKRGYAHEQRYIAALRDEGRQVTELPEKDAAGEKLPIEVRAQQTIEAIRRGDDVIFQGTFLSDVSARGSGSEGVAADAGQGITAGVDAPTGIEGEGDSSEASVEGSVGVATRTAQATATRPATQWRGHPDFLLRVPTPSDLGDFSYEVADTKLAHSTRASALLQICSYVEQLTRIQGREPHQMHVVLGGMPQTTDSFRVKDFMAYYRTIKARFESAVDDTLAGEPVYPVTATYPDPVDHCSVCRWITVCMGQWRRDDYLSLVYGTSRNQRKRLVERGTRTRAAVATLQLPMTPALEGTSSVALTRVREQARLQVESERQHHLLYELLEPERLTDQTGQRTGELVPDRGLASLPKPSPGDLFFDIEGDPFAFDEGLEYLFGIIEPGQELHERAYGNRALELTLGLIDPSDGNGHQPEQPAWHAFWALDRGAEKKAFEAVIDLFMDRLERDPDLHIFHYAAYEPTAMKKLAGRHNTREEEVDRLLRGKVFVDLYRAVRQGVRVGAESYSIKKLEPLYKLQRKAELRDANSSIVEFELYLEEGGADRQLLRNIELYNHDDCVSNWKLRGWLEERRPEAEKQFGIELPRPAASPQEAREELNERIKAVEELEGRLLRHLPADESDRTPEQQATWLLAQLVDWHRREEKSSWWRLYDLLGKSDDELFDEKEPIARLEYDQVVGETRQSLIHRYRFPRQEHDVGAGSELYDPRLGTDLKLARTGSCDGVSDEEGWVDIKRPRDWAGSHPSSIVPFERFDPRVMQDSLMRIGTWVAEHGIDGARGTDAAGSADSDGPDYRAARDLLLRLAPRAGQADGEALVHADESGTDAARRLALALSTTTLAIQGPPGSGKTYAGGRMIVDLVRAGRQIGITAMSHKVITNLLEEAAEYAEEVGFELKAIQKGEGDDACKHPFVTCVSGNAEIRGGLASGEAQVGAGTSWVWARDEMTGSVDTLFVDEAGQMSLADVIAMTGAARNLVLLGDPQQLNRPLQGVHPPGAERSALAHFLGEEQTIRPERGVFLAKTWRLHPEICAFTSEVFYEDRLEPQANLVNQRVEGSDWLAGSGTRWRPVEHTGNTNESEEEAAEVAATVRSLLGRTYTHWDGRSWPLTLNDIVIVSPYNAHRELIKATLDLAVGPGARVGTVDKFQGQEAPVSIYSMGTSSPDDAPRGMDFLYSLNRLNVATSRARALAIVVASPALLAARARTPGQMRLANGLCRYQEEQPHEATGA